MNNGIFFENNELSNLLTENMILNEAYFGKTKELLAAEQQLDKFRSKYLNSYTFNTRVNSDPDLLEFDRMMENIFGFECLTLQIYNTDVFNAGTLPISNSIDFVFNKNNVIVTNNGYKFKPEFGYTCFILIYSGMIFNPLYTTSEIMAIILHEVGHNFQTVIDEKDGVILNLYNIINSLIAIITDPTGGIISKAIWSTKVRRFVANSTKKLRKNNHFSMAVYDVFKQGLDLYNSLMININDIINILNLGIIKGIPLKMYKFIKNPVMGILGIKAGYTKEQIADNFANMYGYGGDLSSALTKMGTNSDSMVMKALDNIPIISTIVHLNQLPFMIVACLFDEHPEEVYRIKDQIKMLKYELDKEDLDPKMTNVLKSDIEACEEALDVLTDCTKGINDPYFGKKLYNSIIKHVADIKGAVFGSSNRYEEYDKIINKGGN
jgi:hypothetical protein